MNNKSISLRVSESSAAGEARRVAMEWVEKLGFPPVKIAEVGIIVTELANNLWRHAAGGEIIFRALTTAGKTPDSAPIRGFEILSIDKGSGMADVEKCLRDGYSSGGTTGIGLGAVARLSSFSEIYTRPKQGTIFLSQIWAHPRPKAFFATPEIGAICVPIKAEQACGDAWAEKSTPAGRQLLLVDALGHGARAAEAAGAAMRIFFQKELAPKEMIQSLHLALNSKVGAVAGLVEMTPRGRTVSFVGVGNIEGRIFHGEEKQSLLSHNGTVGHALQTVRQWHYSWGQNSLLILHTDGIAGKWDLANYPGLSMGHPSVIAGVLYRDFRRERDDAAVIVLREPPD